MQLPGYNDLTDEQIDRVDEFLLVTMNCDDEILNGIDHQITMTLELFTRTVQVLTVLGATRTLKKFLADFREYRI